MKTKKNIILLMLVVLCFASCTATNIDTTTCVKINPEYGFFYGLWHGIIIVFSFIGSLFDDNIAIYAINNTGKLYDLGFLIGIGGIGSGIKITFK